MKGPFPQLSNRKKEMEKNKYHQYQANGLTSQITIAVKHFPLCIVVM